MTTFQEIIDHAYALKECIEHDVRVLELEKLNAQLNQHQELLLLTDRFHALQEDYQRLWELYGDEHPQLLDVQKHLHQLKLQIDQHTLVREYLRAYGHVRQLYQSLQMQIFQPFHTPIKGCI